MLTILDRQKETLLLKKKTRRNFQL